MTKYPISVLIVIVMLGGPSAWAENHVLPDDGFAPGLDNPAVTQGGIQETICRSGWTSTVRPTTSYTNKLKALQLKTWGYPDTNMANYEEDHRVPLEVGGHPSDPGNLWPEPYGIEWGARVKDKLENFVKREICAGRMTLAAGRGIFKANWVDAFKRHCGPMPNAKCKSS